MQPLAHLDAKLRNSMRTELKKIQADLGSTCIYVTHDFWRPAWATASPS